MNIKQRLNNAWNTTKETAAKTINWAAEHPVQTAAILTTAVSGVKVARGIGHDIHQMRVEKENRLSVYCGDIQSRVRLKRELTYYENRELRDRMTAGQTKFEALDAMGLLKK